MVIIHSFLYVYQRVTSGIRTCSLSLNRDATPSPLALFYGKLPRREPRGITSGGFQWIICSSTHTRWCPRSIALSWFITPITMVYR